MFEQASVPSDVFDASEVARAAGVRRADVRALIRAGHVETIDGRFLSTAQAVAAVQLIRSRNPFVARPALFGEIVHQRRNPGGPLAASGALHVALAAVLMLMTAGAGSAERPPERTDLTRLVFIPLPGPGGGGGGGGLKQPTPPQRAELRGTRKLRSPVSVTRAVKSDKPEPPQRSTPPPTPAPTEKPVDPPVEKKPDPTPPVVAPVASVAADTQDKQGTVAGDQKTPPSQGTGSGGGAGTGEGTGMGEGTGAGIGPGSGGGTGGGPYRPGSGITPPSLLREVKPDYTEEARRRGIAGDVVVEIVVRSDGSVGDVRLLQRLGYGLDQRAVEAVRQWRFSPARRYGTPVDVIVEVAVEFKMR
jgi:periplasmic protein TonB